MKREFTIENIDFVFENSSTGKETISIDDTIVSTNRSIIGGGTHKFFYFDDSYEIKVKPLSSSKIIIMVTKNGEVIFNEFKNQPHIISLLGTFLSVSCFVRLFFVDKSESPVMFQILIFMVIAGVFFIVLGAAFKTMRKE